MKKFLIFLGILLLFCLAENEASAQFQLIKDATIVVSKNWKGLSEMDKLNVELRNGGCFDGDITSKNYSRFSSQVNPGDLLIIKFFSISDVSKTSDLIDKIKEENGILLGGVGLPLLYQIKDILPEEKWMISIDKKDSLFNNGGDFRIPALKKYNDGTYCSATLSFENTPWNSQKYILVCFIKK